jgi:hypothetical protein
MIPRIFITDYDSVNGAIHIPAGAIATISQVIDTTDFDVEVDGKTYTLPIMDFLEATKNVGEWTDANKARRKSSLDIKVRL